MSKYAPLGHYLRSQKTGRVPMTFSEIEKIVGTKLPKSQRYPAWWSNNPWNNVMTQVWLDAGFETEQVDVQGRKLVFRRVGAPAAKTEESIHTKVSSSSDAGSPPRHPLIGWMKGTVTVAPGIDLTQPADPEWGEVTYGEKTQDGVK
jgi:hypothetical protein